MAPSLQARGEEALSRFIFMLTRNDVTVADARRVFAGIADLPIPYVGFKDIGLPVTELTALVDDIRSNGQGAMLEVVSQVRDDELKSIRAGIEIGVDYILGGTHAADATKILEGTGTKYMPFPGRIVGHPSELHGTPAEIVASAVALSLTPGVAGLDLLAYRFAGASEQLIAAVVARVNCPVVVAGSIATLDRVRSVCELGAWGFTVGSAAFDLRFAGEKTLRGQLSAILTAADEARSSRREAG